MSPGAGFDAYDAITAHCRGLAAVASGNLSAPVEHCPGWRVGDLVRHLVDVHWFWGTIVGERLTGPPDETRRPAPSDDDDVITTFLAGAERMVRVLREVPADEHVWTWAPGQQNAGFVLRHQVQEAGVHHWDAAHAAGRGLAIPGPEAADAVDEFLTFSVSSDADPATPPRPPLDGRFALVATDAGTSWTVTDGEAPGTVGVSAGHDAEVPVLAATASDLLLWLYGRVPLAPGQVDTALVGRFRALCFTD